MDKTITQRRHLPYAEELGHYWQTSRAGASAWLEKIGALLAKHGASDFSSGVMSGTVGSERAGMVFVAFTYGGRRYRLSQPILPSRTGKMPASSTQAATVLYHYVKTLMVRAKVLGLDTAFVQHRLTDSGVTLAEAPEHLGAFYELLREAHALPAASVGGDEAVEGPFRVIALPGEVQRE